MNRTRSLIAIAGTVTALGSGASAQTQLFPTWNGPTNGSWNAAGNWTPVGVPSNNATNTYAPLIPGGGSPVVSGSILIDKFGIAPGGSISISNNSNLVIRGQTDGMGVTGLLSNEGILAINSGGNLTDLIITGPVGSSAVHGNIFGTPARIQTSNTQANRIYGQAGHEKLIFGAETIFEGAASIGINLLELENFGQLRAVGSAGLTIDPNNAGMTNHGALEAVTGPLFLINGVFRNVGSGAIVANAGQFVSITSARIEGGLLDTSISGSIVPSNSSLVDTRLNGFVRVPNNGNCSLEVGLRLVNSGSTVSLESSGNLTDLILDTDVTIRGVSFNAGVVSSNTQANRIYSNNGRRLTLADTVYIRGSMGLGFNLMSLTVNELCSVEAEGSAGLTIDPDSNGVLNMGVLRARAGSTLALVNGVFANMQGNIIADAGGVVIASGAVINGGLLASGGSGFFSIQTSEINSITSAAELHIPNNNSAFLRSSIVNNSTFNLDSSGNLTNLIIRGDSIFQGAGLVLGSNTQANRIYAEDGVSRLTNAAGHTIRGSMQLGLNLMALTNNGLIESSGPAGMTIDPNGAGVENNSLLRATPSSPLALVNGSFDNIDGTIMVQDNSSCTLSGATITGGILTREGAGFFRLETSELNSIVSSADIRIPNNNSGFLRSTLVNNSVLNLDSNGNLTNLIIRGHTTISGTGTVLATNTQANRVYAEDNDSRLTNAAGHTIRGSMGLGINLMALTNNGLIEAVGPAGMTIDPNGNGCENNSLIRAATGSSINLAAGVFDNADGVIVAQDGSSITASGSIVSGGTLTSAGTGLFQLAGAELVGVTSTAEIRIPNNLNGFLRGTFVNNGTLVLSSSGNLTDLIIRGNTIVSGFGSIVGSNTQANRIYSQENDRRLTNASGHTIRGSMQLGVNLMSITNQGRIIADATGGITIDPNNDGFNNQGELLATGGNLAILAGPFTTSGTVVVDAGRRLDRTSGSFVQTGGTVAANGEIEVVSDLYDLQGGTLGGAGRVDSNVTNSGGTVAPGNSPGTLTIEGNYVQGAGGTLDIEISGVTSGDQNDLLTILGSGQLGGTISISRLNNFTPVLGQGFTILTTAGSNSRTGAFATVVSDDTWSIEYLHNAVVIVFNGAGTGCAADFNDDGFVNPDDLSDYITCFFLDVQFPGTCPAADFNADGFRDPDDLSDFITTFFLGC